MAIKKKELKKPNYVIKGSKDEAAYLKQLENDILKADDDFIAYCETKGLAELQKQDFVQHKFDSDSPMNMMNMWYQRQMMIACVEPLSKGVNKDSIIESIGMYAGMCLVSPSFRKECHATVANVLYPAVEKKAENAGPNSIWAKQRDKVLQAANYGYMPLTPKSAALMQIGFARGCYNKMREPGANPNEVYSQYEQAMDLLRTRAENDGISGADIDRNMRTIVGQMLEKDPKNAMYFNQTAYGGIERAPYETVYDNNGEAGKVWRGQFLDKNGNSYQGGFSPRMPQDKSWHEENIKANFESCWAKCSTVQDVEGMNHDDKMADNVQMWRDMMRADVQDVTDVEIENCMNKSWNACQNDWIKTHASAMNDYAKSHTRSQTYQSKSSGSTKGRGHEFDGRFGIPDDGTFEKGSNGPNFEM